MLNLKEVIKFDINSVKISKNEFFNDISISVFFKNIITDVNSDLSDLIRFRLVLVEDIETDNLLFNSLNTKESLKYFKSDFNSKSCVKYSKDGLIFAYYDISFSDIVSSPSFIDRNILKEKNNVLDFKFKTELNMKNLILYTSVYLDTNKITKKLEISNFFVKDNLSILFETFILDNKTINAKVKDFRVFDRLSSNIFENTYNEKNSKILHIFEKSKCVNGYNVCFLIDFFEIFKKDSRFSYLLKNEIFSNEVLKYISNSNNIKIEILKKESNKEFEILDIKKLEVNNKLHKNNKMLFFSFYDENSSTECSYKISFKIEDILPKFILNIITNIQRAIKDVDYLLSISNNFQYHNKVSDTFNETYFNNINDYDSDILFKIIENLIYFSENFHENKIDKISILSLINEKTLGLDTLNHLLKVYTKLEQDFSNEYLKNKTYNYLEYSFEKSIKTNNNDCYYNILLNNNFESLKKINLNELMNLSLVGVSKYFSSNLESNNTFTYHSINDISFQNRVFNIDSPISKTNNEEFNSHIIEILYYLHNSLNSTTKYKQVFELLFKEYLIFDNLEKFKQSGKKNIINISNIRNYNSVKEILNLQQRIDLLIEILINDFFIEYKNLFDISLINKKIITNILPYQILALYNSFIQSDVVMDKFQSITALEKLIFIFLYKIIFEIQYYDTENKKWKQISNEIIENTKQNILICRFSKYLSDDYLVPYIKELDFELNNNIFIYDNMEFNQNNKISETYLDSLFQTDNLDIIKLFNKTFEINSLIKDKINKSRLK